MSAIAIQSAVRVRAPLVTDRYGAEIRDWDNAVRSPLTRLSIQPAGSSEATGERPTLLITGWRVISDRGVRLDLLATDRVEADGLSLEVNGEVGHFRLGLRHHHTEAQLRQVTG